MLVSALPMSVASVADPATTAPRTASRTSAYSSRSWPDSSRCRFLTNCVNVISKFPLIFIDFLKGLLNIPFVLPHDHCQRCSSKTSYIRNIVEHLCNYLH